MQLTGDEVVHFEQVEVAGVYGTLLTFDREPAAYTVLWERDGLLIELESDQLTPDELLTIAGTVR